MSTEAPGRMQAKAVIVPEVERLHWRIWNGKQMVAGFDGSWRGLL
jgi:hypothetical protein